MPLNVGDAIFEMDVRVGAIFNFEFFSDRDGSIPDILTEAVRDLDEYDDKQDHGTLGFALKEAGCSSDFDDDEDEPMPWATLFPLWMDEHQPKGLVARVATPVKTFRTKDEGGDGGICSMSWGNYYTGWVFGKDMETLAREALLFASNRANLDRVKAGFDPTEFDLSAYEK